MEGRPPEILKQAQASPLQRDARTGKAVRRVSDTLPRTANSVRRAARVRVVWSDP